MAKGIRKKKASVEEFAEVFEACRGVISKVAEALGVDRTTIYNWCNKDKRYQAIIDNAKGRLLDDCLRSARMLAIGIPKDPKDISKGWKEKPDASMLKYLISTLGRREGYGESIDVTSKGESIKPDPVVVEVIDKRDQVIDYTVSTE
jgi:hypothetical protein